MNLLFSIIYSYLDKHIFTIIFHIQWWQISKIIFSISKTIMHTLPGILEHLVLIKTWDFSFNARKTKNNLLKSNTLKRNYGFVLLHRKHFQTNTK